MTTEHEQLRIEDSPFARLHQTYVEAKALYLGAWLHHEQVRIQYETTKAQYVVAVDVARDGASKPLYSNESVRKAEATQRINADPITKELLNAQFAMLDAEAEMKAAGRAYGALSNSFLAWRPDGSENGGD